MRKVSALLLLMKQLCLVETAALGVGPVPVVTKDKAMEGLIDNGEDWMLPLLEFRDFLAETQDPEKKPEIREHRRRNGQVTILNNKLIHGPLHVGILQGTLDKTSHNATAGSERGT